LKQKAALEADICVIKQESKVAAAEVEVRVLEQGEQEHELPSVIVLCRRAFGEIVSFCIECCSTDG
jgi:hypothetical protein